MQYKKDLKSARIKIEDQRAEIKTDLINYSNLNFDYSSQCEKVESLTEELNKVNEVLARKTKDLDESHDRENELKKEISSLKKMAEQARQELQNLATHNAEALRLSQEKLGYR